MTATIIIDVQNDFVSGVLGTPEARAMVPRLVQKLQNTSNDLIFTQDTHDATKYPKTAEGRLVPPHCFKNSNGWQIVSSLKPFVSRGKIVEKQTYGTTQLPALVKNYATIEICGLCTDICVVANAIILRTFYPETKIVIDANCCAGTTTDAHNAALAVMKSCGCYIEY